METLPMFEAGRIWFNPRLDAVVHLDVSSRGDLIGQLVTFMSAADKDLGDAFAYGIKGLRDYKNDEDDDDWNDGSGVATRMSVIGA